VWPRRTSQAALTTTSPGRVTNGGVLDDARHVIIGVEPVPLAVLMRGNKQFVPSRLRDAHHPPIAGRKKSRSCVSLV
jgi:hypothetical protein